MVENVIDETMRRFHTNKTDDKCVLDKRCISLSITFYI